jgi:hypothetical protein
VRISDRVDFERRDAKSFECWLVQTVDARLAIERDTFVSQIGIPQCLGPGDTRANGVAAPVAERLAAAVR